MLSEFPEEQKSGLFWERHTGWWVRYPSCPFQPKLWKIINCRVSAAETRDFRKNAQSAWNVPKRLLGAKRRWWSKEMICHQKFYLYKCVENTRWYTCILMCSFCKPTFGHLSRETAWCRWLKKYIWNRFQYDYYTPTKQDSLWPEGVHKVHNLCPVYIFIIEKHRKFQLHTKIA